MYLVNQDRDQIIHQTQPLLVAPMPRKSTYNGHRYIAAINLYHGDDLLGSFDSDDEALTEMDRITHSKNEIEFVGGYRLRKDAWIVQRLLGRLRS